MRALFACALAVSLFAAVAYADPPHPPAPTEGTVIGLEGGDFVIDLGSTRGAESGSVVELWRVVQLKHPVTGKMVTDRFRIGSLRLTSVRPNLSLAKPEGVMTRPPSSGDIVVLPPAAAPAPFPGDSTAPQAAPSGTTKPPTVAPTVPTGTTPPTPAPTVFADPEAAELSALFDTLKGTSPQARATKYDEFVRLHASSRFAQTLREEAEALRRADRVAAGGPQAEPGPLVVNFAAPSSAYAAAPLEIVVELSPEAKGAVLFARAGTEGTYDVFPMRSRGEGYFAATIPARLVRAPSVALLIEAYDAQGNRHAAVASTADPTLIAVEEQSAPMQPVPVLAQASLVTDFAAWNVKPPPRLDYSWQTEGLVGVRFSDTGFRALRTGFGVYRGASGSLDDLENKGLDTRAVGLTYGTLETEIAPASIFSFIPKGMVGLGENGISGGVQLLFRVGNDLHTNLLFGGEALFGVGLKGIAQVSFLATLRVPVMFRTEVTNQPAGTSSSSALPTQSSNSGDVGVRLIAQIGYQFTRNFEAGLRGSYQGRTINHAGPGGGAYVSIQW